jgi:hypothetical protein
VRTPKALGTDAASTLPIPSISIDHTPLPRLRVIVSGTMMARSRRRKEKVE